MAHGKPLTAEDLIALNREIAALVRAGVPLELGLGGLSSSVPRRLGRLTDRLADRMQAGASLPEALEAEEDRIPVVYRAVVSAGLRSGRLPQALEALSACTRSLIDVRRRLALGLIYPTIVLLAAWVLFALFVGRVSGNMAETYRLLDVEPSPWVAMLVRITYWLAVWGWIVPAAAVALLAWIALRGGLLVRHSAPGGRALAPVPGMGRLKEQLHIAGFCEVLALLVEQEVPLNEALPLAAGAVGDSRFIRDAGTAVNTVNQGGDADDVFADFEPLPPLARWMIAAGRRQAALPATLRQVAVHYHRRARRQADVLKIVLPVALLAVLGGGAVLVYAVSLFFPVTALLRDLAG